jgi:hypothetical protein
LIDKRLQDRLRKETDSVRRAEEAKKDKHTANRKEEEIQLKNTIVSPLCVSLDVGKLRPSASIDSVARGYQFSLISCSRQM